VAEADNIDLTDKTKIPMERVKLELPLGMENSSEEYILGFIAYQEARKSNDPLVLSQLPEYLRMYRKTYGEYLKTLRKSGLTHPLLPKDPAGWFTQKSIEENPEKMVYWRKPRLKSKMDAVKTMVNSGLAAQEVHAKIVAQLPVERPAADQDADLSSNIAPFPSKDEAETKTGESKNQFHSAKGNPDATKHDIAKAHEKFLAHLQARLATYLQLTPDDDEKIKSLREELKAEMKELDKFKSNSVLPF
jgi:hypothetical protein